MLQYSRWERSHLLASFHRVLPSRHSYISIFQLNMLRSQAETVYERAEVIGYDRNREPAQAGGDDADT